MILVFACTDVFIFIVVRIDYLYCIYKLETQFTYKLSYQAHVRFHGGNGISVHVDQ